MPARGIKFNFEPGESVLCFEPDPTKARVIYEAKILDTTVYNDEDGKKKPGYHIHFLRWNNSWDRIVGEQLVLKTTEDNKHLMKQLSDVARKSMKNKVRKKKINEILTEAFGAANPFADEGGTDDGNTTDTNDTGDESSAEMDAGDKNKADEQKKTMRSQMAVDIDIPDSLKAVLDKDYFAVHQGNKFVRLPAEVNVVTVLESFVKSLMMDFWSPSYDRSILCHNPPKISIDRILPMCKEYVDGVRICFDFLLSTTLLYETEKEQHQKLMVSFSHQSPAKQKIPGDDSPLLKSPHSRSSVLLTKDESCPRLPKYSPAEEDEEVTFNPKSTPVSAKRTLRSRSGIESGKKLDFDKQGDSSVKDEKEENVKDKKEKNVKEEKEKNVDSKSRKRRASDRLEDSLKRRPLRSYRKSSEESNDSESSKPETFKSELSKNKKTDKDDPSPPPLIPCNLLGTRGQGKADKAAGKEASGSVDSVGENGHEILSTILQWRLLPVEALAELPTPPALLYGAHHLLRLFVKFPDLLNKMEMDENKLGVLKKLTHLFLEYMSEHTAQLFPESSYSNTCDV